MNNKMSMVAILMDEAIRQRGLSDRAAAEQIGVAHTTVGRIREGAPLDIATIRKIAEWLNIEPTTLLGVELGDDLTSKIAALLAVDSRLKDVFQEAMDRVIDGKMSPSVLRELIAYSVYRLGIEENG